MQINLPIEKIDKLLLAVGHTITHYRNQKDNLTVANGTDAVLLDQHFDNRIKENVELMHEINKQMSEQHSF
jgi:hypothetical protein